MQTQKQKSDNTSAQIDWLYNNSNEYLYHEKNRRYTRRSATKFCYSIDEHSAS